MNNSERVLEYLRRVAPQSASNREILRATGIKPHQQVFQITQKLLDTGLVRGSKVGNEWHFGIASPASRHSAVKAVAMVESAALDEGVFSPAQFQALAQRIMSQYFGVELTQRKVARVNKIFDFVSPDFQVIGDAKYYTLVGGERLPPAKFSAIAEHVWLLEKTETRKPFLVFGREKQVPEWWLERYGSIRSNVAFFFLTDEGRLEVLRDFGVVRARGRFRLPFVGD